MSRIVYLVAVDGSEWSERAAERAVSLAKSTKAEVHFITVIPWSGYQPLTLEEVTNRPLDKKLEEKHARSDVLKPLNKRFEDSGVTIENELFWGNPKEIIHEQAKKEHVNMIFVGRRGRSKVINLVMGSVADALAHTAGVPIVLVP